MQVSPRAAACPRCGAPLRATAAESNARLKAKGRKFKLVGIATIFASPLLLILSAGRAEILVWPVVLVLAIGFAVFVAGTFWD